MLSEGCGCNNDVLFSSNQQSGVGGANIEIIGNPPIQVQTQVLSTKTKFTISYNEAIALAGNLSISNVVTSPSGAAYLSGNTPLKGATVTDLTLSWTLTKEGQAAQVAIQVLDDVGIDNTLRQYTYDSLTLESTSPLADRTFELVADDGLGNPGSSVTLESVLEFGNKIYKGEGALIEDDDLALQTLLYGMAFDIRKNKGTSFSPQSLSPYVYVYIAIPTEFGTTEFRDTTSPIEVNPMRLLKGSFTLSNGIDDYPYNIYVSKQGALRGSVITTI